MKTCNETISLNLTECTSSRHETLEVGVEQTVGQIRPQIIESLGLSETDFGGDPVTWVLYNESDPSRQVLSDTDLVGDVLKEGETIMTVPNIIGGGILYELI